MRLPDTIGTVTRVATRSAPIRVVLAGQRRVSDGDVIELYPPEFSIAHWNGPTVAWRQITQGSDVRLTAVPRRVDVLDETPSASTMDWFSASVD